MIEAQFIVSKDIILSPGPGQYSPTTKYIHKSKPNWSISKDAKDKALPNNGPGPGSYAIPSKI